MAIKVVDVYEDIVVIMEMALIHRGYHNVDFSDPKLGQFEADAIAFT